MLRYKRLLLQALDPDAAHPMSLRDLARAMKIPVPSLHSYVQFDTLPRIDNVGKMAAYFGESVSSLFSEDDDTTAALVALVRRMDQNEKATWLQKLKKQGKE